MAGDYLQADLDRCIEQLVRASHAEEASAKEIERLQEEIELERRECRCVVALGGVVLCAIIYLRL